MTDDVEAPHALRRGDAAWQASPANIPTMARDQRAKNFPAIFTAVNGATVFNCAAKMNGFSAANIPLWRGFVKKFEANPSKGGCEVSGDR